MCSFLFFDETDANSVLGWDIAEGSSAFQGKELEENW